MCFILFPAKYLNKNFQYIYPAKQKQSASITTISFKICLKQNKTFFIAKVNRVLLIEFMCKFSDTSTHKNKFNHGKIVKFCILAKNLTIPPKMELRTFCSKSYSDVLPCFGYSPFQ